MDKNTLNVKSIREKMKNKPKLYKLYNFFLGVPKMLTEEQLEEFKLIVVEENEKLIKYLDKHLLKLKKQNKSNA